MRIRCEIHSPGFVNRKQTKWLKPSHTSLFLPIRNNTARAQDRYRPCIKRKAVGERWMVNIVTMGEMYSFGCEVQTSTIFLQNRRPLIVLLQATESQTKWWYNRLSHTVLPCDHIISVFIMRIIHYSCNNMLPLIQYNTAKWPKKWPQSRFDTSLRVSSYKYFPGRHFRFSDKVYSITESSLCLSSIKKTVYPWY